MIKVVKDTSDQLVWEVDPSIVTYDVAKVLVTKVIPQIYREQGLQTMECRSHPTILETSCQYMFPNVPPGGPYTFSMSYVGRGPFYLSVLSRSLGFQTVQPYPKVFPPGFADSLKQYMEQAVQDAMRMSLHGGWATARKTNPKLWHQIVERVKAEPGPWAAWKAMKAVRIYKEEGGRYK